MSLSLSKTQINFYKENGFIYPIKIFSKNKMKIISKKLESFEKKTSSIISGANRHKAHLLFDWMDDLVRNKLLLNIIQDILGENIFCWGSDFFIKEPRDKKYVSWHQDAKYWGLYPYEIATAWLAISDATINKGPMEVIPKSHKCEIQEHIETRKEDNLLTRGQKIKIDLSNKVTIKMPLNIGEVSIHHGALIHRSGLNKSNSRRIGIAIRYISTKVMQINGSDSATLVRGKDDFNNFIHEKSALYSSSNNAKNNHKIATRLLIKNIK